MILWTDKLKAKAVETRVRFLSEFSRAGEHEACMFCLGHLSRYESLCSVQSFQVLVAKGICLLLLESTQVSLLHLLLNVRNDCQCRNTRAELL